MNTSDGQKWLLASEQLEYILQLPLDDQASALHRIGKELDIESELEQLLQGTRHASVLDDSLDSILEEMPSDIITRDALCGRRFGSWLLEKEIGRGGMSVVYLATRAGDGYTQRAALKILSIAFLNDSHVASFLSERKILSELTHPGIARLIDGGVTPDGAPYLVMDLVEGQRIDTWCREHQANTRSVLQLVVQVCRATSHAHRHLVVHRDINPSNVLMDHLGNPKLVDFGIAKVLDSGQTGKTLHAFTPEFAAPEQLRGDSVTTATDIYGLGRLLSSLLHDRKLDRDLQMIINAATHEDADQRYATAKFMADDLQAWLDNRPVKARPDSFAYRAKKFTRRHWHWLSVAVLTLLVALSGVLSTLWQAENSRREAEKHKAVANFILHIFEQADLMQTGSHLRVTDLLETAAQQAQNEVKNDPATLVSLLTLIASGQLELTNYDAAASALDEAEKLIQANEISSADRAAYLRQRGKESYELGDFGAAVNYLETAVNLLKGDRAEQKQYYLAGATLAGYLIDSESYEDARDLTESLLFELKDQSPDFEVLAQLTHKHAIALEVTGDINAAFDQYQQALRYQRSFQPDNLLGRAAILSDYGIAFYFDGQFAESEKINREVLELFVGQLRSPHPRIASSLHNLAFSLVGQQRLEEAIGLLTQAYEMTIELHGTDHIDSLLEQATLATLIMRSGDFERAEPLLRENITTLERIAPEMQVQRGSVHSYLGDVFLQTGRLEASRAEYHKALQLFAELPDENIRVVEARERLEEIAGKMQQ
jgi:serine/threonine-protein kinase